MYGKLFDNSGTKAVSKNDKKKGAYVPNKAQRRAIEAAGKTPKQGVPFDVTVLGDPGRKSVETSFYLSLRKDPKRTPEPRMGFELISRWLQPGQRVTIGNVGKKLFAFVESQDADPTTVVAGVASRASLKDLRARAKSAEEKPAQRTVQRSEFVRSPLVAAAVIQRAQGKCEMPGCNCELFSRTTGDPYLEVHHVTPLAEGGYDTLLNTAALCPRCHRELHHGEKRTHLRSRLATAIRKKEAS